MRSPTGKSGGAKAPFFPWSDDYSVHVRVIDNDHKELVSLVNELHAAIAEGASEGVIGHVIAGLARYANEHFEREEKLMAEYGFPALASHREQHRLFTQVIAAFEKVHGEAPGDLDHDRLSAFLKDWLVHHILGSDRRYVPYLLGEAAPEPPPAAADPAPIDPTLEETVEVTVTVPRSRERAIQRCAYLLRMGGEGGAAIVDIVEHPLLGLSLEEAKAIIHELFKD